MKKRIQTMIIFAAMICMTISGCSEGVETPTNTSATYPTVKISVTTVTSAIEVIETTAISSTAVWTETVTEAVVAVTNVTAPQTETLKVEVKTPEFYETTEPTEIITEPPVITDDTKLTHAEFCNAENMNRVASGLVDYYIAKGMKYDSSISTSNSGWMYVYQGGIDKTAVRSYNEHWDRIVIGMDEQLEAFMTMYPEAKYTDLSFNCYEELQSDGEYDIYFCYK